MIRTWKKARSFSIHRQTKFIRADHSMKQTLEKRSLVDIAAVTEMVERNEINIT